MLGIGERYRKRNMITGILHATFLTTDLPQARAFYEGVLGLRPDPTAQR